MSLYKLSLKSNNECKLIEQEIFKLTENIFILSVALCGIVYLLV